MKRVSIAHKKKINKVMKEAAKFQSYNSDNSWSGEVIQVNEKLANSVIEDIMLKHATLYQLANDRQFELHYTPGCYWKITL